MTKFQFFSAFFFAMISVPSAQASPIVFAQTTLQTSTTDPSLVNPWGMSSSATGPFWISDNGTGQTTLYNTAGVKQGLVVGMPTGSEKLTGQVFNGTTEFNNDTFLFATENGTITGWRGVLGTKAETLFSIEGANYKGLAISTDKTKLYAANFAAGTIDVFTSKGRQSTFTDPSVPAGYAPWNIQNLNGTLYVTYALRDINNDSVAGAGNGFVSTFDPLTNKFTRLASKGVLNAPWGLAIAPSSFGIFGGDLLVGNFGNGIIDAFSLADGSLIGALDGIDSLPLINDGLWGLIVGNGGRGGVPTSLYISAGPDSERGGLFARIDSTPLARTVPEPSTLLLLGIGVVAISMQRRRARSY